MNEFALGLAWGAVGGIGALVVLLRSGSTWARGLREKVLGQQVVSELPNGIVDDVRKTDPGLAQAIETPPAVPVDTVPDELPRDRQEAIERAQTHEEAETEARRFIRNPDVARAIATLVRWKPRPNRSESQYQNSFRLFASKNGYGGVILEQERIPWGGGGGSRIAVPDFILDNRLLLEFKADLEASGDTDRAMGQMLRYLLAWKSRGPAILAVCGKISPELRFLVRVYVQTWRKQLNLPVTVFFKRDDEALQRDECLEMPTDEPKLERTA